ILSVLFFFFFQAEDGIRDPLVTGVQTCALPIFSVPPKASCNSELFWALKTAPGRLLNTLAKLSARMVPPSVQVIAPLLLIVWPRSEERRVGKEWRSRGVTVN